MLLNENLIAIAKKITPFIPNLVTGYVTTCPCMKVYQEILKQCSFSRIPEWFSEGAYHIAKEFQLLGPHKHKNVLLGMGTFHT